MHGMSAGFHAAMDALGDAAGRDSRDSFLMLDPSSGAAQLRVQYLGGAQRTATVTRWLAVVRVGHRAGSIPATRVFWLLDPGSAESPMLWFHARGGRNAPHLATPPPLQRGRRSWRQRGRTVARVLAWPPLAAFRLLRTAVRRARAPWRFTAAGVLGTAGIVDGASARVSRWPLGWRGSGCGPR